MASLKPAILALSVAGFAWMSWISFPAAAQEPYTPIAGEDHLGVSAGGGFSLPHTDFKHSAAVPAAVFGADVHYFSLDFLTISLGFQKGMLKGGEPLNESAWNKTGFENNFYSFCLSFRLFPFALAENESRDKVLHVLSFWYAGTGLGYMYNDTKANYMQQAVYGSLVRYKGSSLFVPVETGINIPLARPGKNMILLNISYRLHLCFSDEIDGYVPTVEANKYNDAFSTLGASVIYKFGL
ncbi:MAG TPA: hypothetical protein VFS31_18380 [Chitinophagaceae bacterium]|nr:hypothetical protein [Chitinophagaceae bacterium]